MDTSLAFEPPVATPASPGATARLIEYTRGRYAALPPYTTIELVENPLGIVVPGAACYSQGVIPWHGGWLPMIDIETLLRAYPKSLQTNIAPRYALVVAYQRAPGLPVEHGAIALSQLPQTISIADSAFCELPEDSDLWPQISLSCFRFEKQAVAVIDTTRLFGSYHR